MLKGVVALVTGGASGLGKATVERVIRQGGKAVICDLPTSSGADLSKELGSNSVFCPVDVTSESDVQNALKVTRDTFGRLDTLVNCAGIAIVLNVYNFKTKWPHKLEHFNRVLAINTMGTFNVVRLAVELMAKNEPDDDGSRGVIINTSSGQAYDGQSGRVAYCMSKAAILGMTLPLARELAPHGIRVCTIAPGMFDTPLVEPANEEEKPCLLQSILHPKRYGKPAEFALLVQSIIENPLLNGEVIRLDNGLRLPPYITKPDKLQRDFGK